MSLIFTVSAKAKPPKLAKTRYEFAQTRHEVCLRFMTIVEYFVAHLNFFFFFGQVTHTRTLDERRSS